MLQSRRRMLAVSIGVASLSLLAAVGLTSAAEDRGRPKRGADADILKHARKALDQGKKTFRFDTFGDEAFWGDALRLHEAIAGERTAASGPGLSPDAALALGLKVDVEALPADVVAGSDAGHGRPRRSRRRRSRCCSSNAVVGVTGFFDDDGQSELDRASSARSATRRSTTRSRPASASGCDGWANRDLNVGAIVALAPDLGRSSSLLGVDEATVRTVLRAGGPASSTPS